MATACVMMLQFKAIFCTPEWSCCGRQLINPLAKLPLPMRDILLLNVSDHRGKRMIGCVCAVFEALDSSARTVAAEEILARVTLATDRCGKPLAFNGQEYVVRRIMPVTNPN